MLSATILFKPQCVIWWLRHIAENRDKKLCILDSLIAVKSTDKWAVTTVHQYGKRSHAILSSCTYHGKAVANPHPAPALGTIRHNVTLTVYCHDVWRGFTDGAATDVWLDLVVSNGVHHGRHGLRGRQPVAVVITWGHSAAVVKVTEHKRHGAESGEAGTSCAWNRQTDWITFNINIP